MTSGANEIAIQKAVHDDIGQIKQIADAYRKELGFVRRPALLEAIDRSEVFVARRNGQIIGFVEYRHRRDEQTTLYNIAVVPEYIGQGVGNRLIAALISESEELGKAHILLKCPEELPSNQFYKALGFQLHQTEPGKSRRLNIWRWILSH